MSQVIDQHLVLLVRVGLNAVGEARWEGRCSSSAAREAAAPASVLRSSAPTPPRSRVMVANLALELAPIRVNLSLPGSSTAPVRNAARRPARRANYSARFRSDAPTSRRARRARQDQHRAHRRDRRRRGCLTRESRPAADALRVSPRSVGLTRFWSAKDSRDVRYPVSGWRRPGVRFEFRGNPIPGRRLVASLRHLRRACAGGMSPECAVTPEHRLALAR